MRTPSFKDSEALHELHCRTAPYWNILRFCRHIGLEKRAGKPAYWLARVRKTNGGYRQKRLMRADIGNPLGSGYEAALDRAEEWFKETETRTVSARSYPVGVTQNVRYVSGGIGFTVGDALLDYVEWKRLAATQKTFESLVSLINFHLIPALGDTQLSELTGRRLTDFCRAVLESPPKRGNRKIGPRREISDLTKDQLRRRKGTLNTLLGILRVAAQMAWENGEVETERVWRCIRRVPNLEVPRQVFLSREECHRLIRACRPDLADLVRAALYTGCRVSELSELRVRDVGKDVFGLYIAPGKSHRSRFVFLPTEGMRFFLAKCEGKGADERIFRNRNGHLWDGKHKHLFKEAVLAASLPKEFVFHGLRHTYASQLVQAGTPLAVVARQLGHANTDTVSRTYGHLSCQSIETEIEKRFAMLERQPTTFDSKMASIRRSLQGVAPKSISEDWPRSNFSKTQSDLLLFVSGRREASS